MNLTGRWIGETQGLCTEEHHWTIIQQGARLNLYTRWESEPRLSLYSPWLTLHEQSFVVETARGDHQAQIQTQDSFIVLEWIDDSYNVLFRRQDLGLKRVMYQLLLKVLVMIRDSRLRYCWNRSAIDPVLRFIK